MQLAFCRPLLTVLASCSVTAALAQSPAADVQLVASSGPNSTRPSESLTVRPDTELAEAHERVREAVQVVRRMKAIPDVRLLMARAQGLFLVTDYGRVAAGIGMQGGQGVLVTRQGDDFGNPVFYNMGALTIGPQLGASGGEVAYLLMTDRAVARFRSDRNFSLTAGAGLTFANYQARGLGATGKVNDVIIWSGAPGLYAGLNVGVMGIRADGEANRAYYGREDATPPLILSDRIANPHNNLLAMVLRI